MPTVLVTGANRGLGLEFVRQYAGEGWRVIAACRRPAEARALHTLDGNVPVHLLDVSDFASTAALDRELAGERVDVCIANAGVNGPRDMTPEAVDAEGWVETFRVNALALPGHPW